MLALGALMIPASRLADLLGRKRILLLGLAMFGLASLLCGLAPSAPFLIAARVVQGIGGAMILPVAFALISNATSAEARPRILGVVIGAAKHRDRPRTHRRRGARLDDRLALGLPGQRPVRRRRVALGPAQPDGES